MRKNKKNKIKINEKNILKIAIISLLLIISYVIMMFGDYTRVVKGKKPLICFATNTYEDGGSKEYFCLLYKIISYDAMQGRNDVEIGTFFLKFDNAVLDKSVADREEITDFIDIRGKVEKVLLSDSGVYEVQVIGEIYADTLYDNAIVKIKENTVIEDSNGKITVRDLKVGDNVEVTFATLAAAQYPAKADAKLIKKQN